MKHGTPCSQVEFDELRIGDYLVSAYGVEGVIINKLTTCDTAVNAPERNMLVIRWSPGNLSFVYHYMADMIKMV